jgi:biopolymer transport protein ExbB
MSRALLLGGLLLFPWAVCVRAEPEAEAAAERVIAGPGAIDADWALDAASLARSAGRSIDSALLWYRQTPPGDRVAWGGLAVSSLLGLSILLERAVRLRTTKIIPSDFTLKFLDRLHGGKLDAGSALDYCEENPSPAARVALAAVRRWGRPAADLERAVALAHRVETDRLKRNAGTLRRIAALTPLLGFLGTLFAISRSLLAMPPETTIADGLHTGLALGPELASALAPLTAGIVLATLAIVAYDGLIARIERLTADLDRLGAETIDAIAMTAPCATSPLSVPTSRGGEHGGDGSRPAAPRSGTFGLVRTPHQPSAAPGRKGPLRRSPKR